MQGATESDLTIRSFCPADAEACKKLYHEGLLGGHLAENDTGLDIDDIETAYLKMAGNHFWVAQLQDGQIVGMIGVQHHEKGLGEIRRLRVRTDVRRRGIGTRLMEVAVKFCADQQYLKITLDTFIEREPALRLFEKFRFRHSRTRKVGDRDLMYFYLDIYGTDQKRGEGARG
jgi:ribosomal protein S18 acetylase RimI-like enzyme